MAPHKDEFHTYNIDLQVLKPGVRTYKRKFDRELRHVKLILTQQRRRMPVGEWLDLVQRTKDCIKFEPESFLCMDLPADQVIREALDHVFVDFLEDQRLLANQTSGSFRIPTAFKLK